VSGQAGQVARALAELLEQMGHDAGYSVATLGVDAGIPSSRLFRVFAGEEVLTVDDFYRLADTFDVAVGDLFMLAERQAHHNAR